MSYLISKPAKMVIAALAPSFRDRKLVVRSIYIGIVSRINGSAYASTLRGKLFVAYFLATAFIEYPVMMLVGIPMALVLYLVGMYGIFA